MSILDHYELTSERQLEEYRSLGRVYRHRQAGARILSIENEDENKVFGIAFRTPPSASDGLPHIMEHSVLCGSRKYPVKKPFVELLKGSLNTFLNAMTYPDRTVYPVASQNLQDFYNLVDVYLDSVFHPLISPLILQQEGWHYELAVPDGDLAYKGVVYNEMKGVYSSPENILSRYNRRTLFPETVYQYDSGGQPDEIVTLNYTRFREFHTTYYHPSNAWIYFYGDDDPQKRLLILNEYLSEYGKREGNSHIALQPRFDGPRSQVILYDASQETVEAKAYVTLNWLLEEGADPVFKLSMVILAHILLGTPASPLRKALFDSGLGEDLAGDGLETELAQMYFSAGLKGVQVEDITRIESFILHTLNEIASVGIDPDMLSAALNTVEFRLRENNSGSLPRGLLIYFRALSNWLYEGDPFIPLQFSQPLAQIKGQLEKDSRFFENLIQKYLVENSHRVALTLLPDPELRARQDETIRAELAARHTAMSAEEKQQIWEQNQALKEFQETPDAPEALSQLPLLRLEDIERENRIIPSEVQQVGEIPLLYHDLNTNGIVYLDLGFDLRYIEAELVPLVPLFGRALLEMGTRRFNYVELSHQIGRDTGGLRTVTFVSNHRQGDTIAAQLFLRGKSTMEQSPRLLEIMADVLQSARLENQARFKQMVLEEKAEQESMLVPAGHRLVNLRLRANFDKAGWANEQMGGIAYLEYVRALAREVEGNWPAVQTRLERLRSSLIHQTGLLCNLTADRTALQTVTPRLVKLVGNLPAGEKERANWPSQLKSGNEGFTIPAQVNYVGKGAALYRSGYEFHASSLVVTRYLRTSWLWEQVRVRGGAYGVFSLFDHRSGVFSFLSYRDPNLSATLNHYDDSVEYLRNLDIDADELSKAIIGVIGELDAYQLPDAKGYTSMQRYLVGDDDNFRRQIRSQVLATTLEDFRKFANEIEKLRISGQIVALGSPESLQAALIKTPGLFKLKNLL